MSRDPVDELLGRLHGVRPGGQDTWTARCPAHEDRQASLSVSRGDDGRALVKCHAGCGAADVAQAAGMELRELFAARETGPTERWPRDRHETVPDLPSEEQVAAWRDALQSDLEHLNLIEVRKGWSPATLARLGIGWDGSRFTMPVRREDASLRAVLRYHPERKPKMMAAAGSKRDLYPAPPAPVGSGLVWLVEGEPDAVTAHELGMEAVGIPGASGFKAEHARLFAGRDVAVCMDADGPGRLAAKDAAELLAAAGARPRIVELFGPLRSDGADLGDALMEANGTRGTLAERLDAVARSMPLVAPPPAKAKRRGEMIATPLSAVKMRPVRWLWGERIPRGELSILCGLPGHGKSTWLALLAAHVTRSGERVAIVSNEDSLETTGAPRMAAAGADLDLVVSINVRLPGRGGEDAVVLPDDLDALLELVERSKAALVIVDPISAHLGDEVNANSEQDVRQKALAPLARMAQDRDCAVLLVAHLNKAQGGDPLSRINGSGGFGGQARSAHLLGRHPDDDPEDDASRVVLAHVKASHGPKRRSIAFARELVPVGPDGQEAPALRELGDSDVRDVDLLAGMLDSEERDAVQEAVIWLRVQLSSSGGEETAARLLVAAKKEGISERTLRRAKRQLKVESVQRERSWWWALNGSKDLA